MKRDYLALWGILAVAFVIFFALSTCKDHIKIGAWELKTTQLSSVFFDSDSLTTVNEAADSADNGAGKSEKQQRVMLDSSPKTVLIIGDSMLEGLTPRLAAYCAASGYKLYSVIWYSSTTELYGESRLLSDYIRVIHPDYIFISLGGNELFVNDVVAKRSKCVKSIVDEIGDIPFVWIGPPNWKPDTGINDLICSSVPKGCFFLSDGMHFERKRDGAHPTQESATEWMDSIVRWAPDHARYYMPLVTPESRTMRPTRYYLHSPGKLTERPK